MNEGEASPVLLVILDGFGLNPNRRHNGWAQASTPYLDHYFATWPHTALQASGLAVGLPDGQFGNSEVGHLTLGAGRVLDQDLLRICDVIHDGSLTTTPEWQALVATGKRLHLVGMVSDGGVHSHIDHLLALLPLVKEAGMEPVIHMITDGRDTPPREALVFLEQLEAALQRLGCGRIATVSGRYCAMDRARHWDRTERAWRAMVLGQGQQAATAREAIENAYARGEGDEFIQPTVVGDPRESRIAEDEAVLIFNFRSDRARQLAAALGLEDFSGFDRGDAGIRRLVCMTQYNAKFPFPVLFPQVIPERVLAEVISDAGLRQFHCAEREKYPHVTYFFNGGREKPFPGEDRDIIPSPTVATYDLKPEMSAPEVADRVIEAIDSGQYRFILVNFANTDMVGHTAVVPAILRAVETVDLQSHRVIRAARRQGFRVLLTADHGNCDEMVDAATGEPHTQHTAYPVPLVLIGEAQARLGVGRGLADVAPTVLELLGLPVPEEMTGSSLLLKKGLCPLDGR
ncbi:MAG TPA: 2,3-bisphosphoglycerate-independent phosphoglycerate mutase [Gammaproteobacteria bacterium]|nr:2,3-bisphosphoglycerate-independent phosphoglycerate mutase [Gammaproteobacteria bacterium]